MDLIDFFSSVLANVVAGAAGGALVWSLRSSRYAFWRAGHRLLALLGRRAVVLFWTDITGPANHRLRAAVADKLTRFDVEFLREPQELWNYPLQPSVVRAVVLIVTDVTKLSERESTRDDFGHLLADFVGRGGGLVLTHDAIYRRTRNVALQALFRGRVERFDARDSIEYRRASPPADLDLTGVPEAFTLDDGELLHTAWTHDNAHHVFVTADTPPRPLVVCAEEGQGRIAWMNSADFGKDGLAGSLSRPDPNLVALLATVATWVSGRR